MAHQVRGGERARQSDRQTDAARISVSRNTMTKIAPRDAPSATRIPISFVCEPRNRRLPRRFRWRRESGRWRERADEESAKLLLRDGSVDQVRQFSNVLPAGPYQFSGLPGGSRRLPRPCSKCFSLLNSFTKTATGRKARTSWGRERRRANIVDIADQPMISRGMSASGGKPKKMRLPMGSSFGKYVAPTLC